MLRTADAVAPILTAGDVQTSLAMYLALYALLLFSFVFPLFHMARRAGEPAPGAKTPGGLFAPQGAATR